MFHAKGPINSFPAKVQTRARRGGRGGQVDWGGRRGVPGTEGGASGRLNYRILTLQTLLFFSQGAPLPQSERKHLSPVASYHPAIQLPPINSGGKHLGVGGGTSRLPAEDSGRRQHVAPLFGDDDEAQQLQQQQQQFNDPAAPEMYDSAPPPEMYEPSPATEARFHQHALDNTGMLAAFHEPAVPHHGAAAFLPPLDAPPAVAVGMSAPSGASPKAQQQRLAVRDLQVGEMLEGRGVRDLQVGGCGTCRWGSGRGI